MFQPITLAQTIELVLLQKWIVEVILKEVKDSNESRDSTMNFTRIIMNHNNKLPPLKKILVVEVQERRKKVFFIIVMKSMSLAINIKWDNFFY